MFKLFRVLSGVIVVLSIHFLILPVWATPEYAEKTGQNCLVCHVKPEGGELTPTGQKYATSGYTWPPKKKLHVIAAIPKPVRVAAGFFHIIAAFLWFGTILYVHIILKPAYASKGLPRGEMLIGIFSMAVVGFTGILLTASRIQNLGVLFKSTWGLMLFLKILLYLLMVSSAAIVVIFIRPRLGIERKRASLPKKGIFDAETLSDFDGKEGRPAYLAFKGTVYDVTELEHWKEGIHMSHFAGYDLTKAILKAPHGPEKPESARKIGSFDASIPPLKTPAQKAFYVIAYMNLILVFAVLFVLAFWRFGV